MSEKDKKTIIIAAIALLIFGIIMLGIKPGITNLKEAKATNAELSQQKQDMKTEIDSLPTYKTQLDAAKAEYSTTASRVFGDLTNDKIHDEVVEKLITPVGVEITGLNIGGILTQSIAPYSISEEGASSGETEGSIKLADINVNVTGTTNQIIAFVDLLNKTEGTYLRNVSFANANEATSVGVSFYMVLADSFN